MKNFLVAAGIAVLLAGCGSDGADGSASSGSPTAPGQGGAGGDSFVDQVAATMEAGGDESEPVSVEGINATSPEDTEPSPVS